MKEKKSSPLQKVFNVWGIILIAWSFYRAKLQLPEAFDEFIAKPLIFVLPVYYYIRNYENKPFLPEINFTGKKLPREIAIGILVGIPIFASSLLSYYFKNGSFAGLQQGVMFSAIGFYFIMALVTAFSQEVLSRGFVLKRIYKEWKNIYSASFAASILFFILHIPALFASNQITGGTLLFLMASTISLSFINSFVYLSERSLVPGIIIHALYSTSIFIFF